MEPPQPRKFKAQSSKLKVVHSNTPDASAPRVRSARVSRAGSEASRLVPQIRSRPTSVGANLSYSIRQSDAETWKHRRHGSSMSPSIRERSAGQKPGRARLRRALASPRIIRPSRRGTWSHRSHGSSKLKVQSSKSRTRTRPPLSLRQPVAHASRVRVQRRPASFPAAGHLPPSKPKNAKRSAGQKPGRARLRRALASPRNIRPSSRGTWSKQRVKHSTR
jgi:hypothetical protein